MPLIFVFIVKKVEIFKKRLPNSQYFTTILFFKFFVDITLSDVVLIIRMLT